MFRDNFLQYTVNLDVVINYTNMIYIYILGQNCT